MDIKYMIEIKKNPVLDGFKNRGFTIDKIEDLEKKYNQKKEFPKVFIFSW